MNKFFLLALCLCAVMIMPIYGQCQKTALIPAPAKMQFAEGKFQINHSTRIYYSANKFKHSAELLSALIFGQNGKGQIIPGSPVNAERNYILLREVKDLPVEGCRLNIKNQNVVLEAKSSVGLFYAIQTIRQLLPVGSMTSTKANLPSLPNLTIEDYPRYAWRGTMLDVSRHFITPAEMKTFMDYMALYKLNHLHLHLTDDQGWRVEIKKYPLLTERGAWREHNKQDIDCLNRAKEDPTFFIPEKNYKEIEGKKMYGGFYTQEQLRDLIRYAQERYITIIPEIDMPGHFNAAVNLYPELSCSREAGWGSLFSFPACPSKESTYEFMKNVLSEIVAIFPAPYIHIGGDEVNVDSWKKCPLCQASIQKNGLKDEHELQSDFNRKIEAFLHSKGKKLLGWDEITEGGLTKDATVMWWRNWVPQAPYKAVKNGNDLVMAPDFQYYLSAENFETPLQKVYDYEPCPKDFSKEDIKHLLGIQACFWSEQIPNFTRLQFQAFPRLLALAETAWSQADRKAYNDFYSRILNSIPRFDAMKIHFHLPPVEGLKNLTVFTDNATLDLKIPLSDMKVYYTLDGTAPTQQSSLYTRPVVIDRDCKVRVRSYRGENFSEIFEGNFEKQTLREPVNPEGLQSGIKRTFMTGHFESTKDLNPDQNSDVKIVQSIDTGEYSGREFYGLIFTGFIKVEKDGIYEFFSNSDDGNVLLIGNTMVVNNDGSHEAIDRSGMIALKAGYHPITVKYHQRGGGYALKIDVCAPGETRRPLSANELFHQN